MNKKFNSIGGHTRWPSLRMLFLTLVIGIGFVLTGSKSQALASSQVKSADLVHRLGVGVKNNTVFDLPTVAAVYYFSDQMAITGGYGTDTAKDNSRFTLNTGLRRILYKEPNMHYYFGGQFGLVNYEVSGDKQSGFEINVIAGGEFFFTGLDSLGFSFEAGAGITSMREVRFRTVADHPFRAGIIFYF